MAASATFMHSTFLANSLAYGAGKNKSVRMSHLVAPTVHSYPQIRICSMAKVIILFFCLLLYLAYICASYTTYSYKIMIRTMSDLSFVG